MKRLKFYTKENDKTLSNYSFITPSTSYFSIEEGFLGNSIIEIQKGGFVFLGNQKIQCDFMSEEESI